MGAPPHTARLPEAVAAALARGQTVVTANQRAARALRRSFDTAQRASGKKRWAPAPILTLDAWAAGLWHRMLIHGTASRMPLNRSQEHAIWRGLISSDREVSALRSTDGLAEMAAEAWSLLCRYNGQARLRDAGVSTDTAAFQRWAMAFERRCRRDGYLSGPQLWEALEVAATQGELPVPDAGIALVGFDRLVPAVETLFDTLRRAGFAIEEVERSPACESGMLFEASDERNEVRAAARWARRRLTENPKAQLAIVVPNLEARRTELQRTLREILAPELQDIAADDQAVPYEFSLGKPLSSMAQVATALQLIRWTMEPLETEEATAVLLSRFFAGGSLDLAEFDAFRLRDASLLRPEIALDWMIGAAGLEKDWLEKDSERTADLSIRLRSMQRAASEEGVGAKSNAERSHGDWADAFRKLLAAAGWPGPHVLDSVSFQARQRWESALDELCTLDFEDTRLSSAQALAALERIVQQTVFAPESHDAPLQVMGPLEAAGQNFDGLWFLGASDMGWPQQRQSSPLLPWKLQRELGMPGADTVADLALAKAITQRIAGAAREVIFSYALRAAEAGQRASPLLEELKLNGADPDLLLAAEEMREVEALEVVPDDLPLSPLPETVLRGGASVLQAQAACGFKAFAEHRLWSTELQSTPLGLDPGERGSLVHKAMEKFWSEVRDQATLKSMTEEVRERTLDEAIDAAIARVATRHRVSATWELAYIETQRQRLRALLQPWLAVELSRTEFSVAALESKLEAVRIGPLLLDVRVDRIDETASGSLILDYKTGDASPNEWLSDRPDEPQLPLYAVVSNEPPAGVAFALLRAGDDLSLQGLASDPAALPKTGRFADGVETFRGQLDEWRRVLTNLAEDFRDGDARVAPKKYPETCEYCAQRLLCRLDPAALAGAGERDDEEADLG